jgi:hypothetical protein
MIRIDDEYLDQRSLMLSSMLFEGNELLVYN